MCSKCSHTEHLVAVLTLKIAFLLLLQRPSVSLAWSFQTAQPSSSWWPFIMMSALRLKSIQYLQDNWWWNINRMMQTHSACALPCSWSVHLLIDLSVADSVMELRSSDYHKQTGCVFVFVAYLCLKNEWAESSDPRFRGHAYNMHSNLQTRSPEKTHLSDVIHA